MWESNPIYSDDYRYNISNASTSYPALPYLFPNVNRELITFANKFFVTFVNKTITI